MDVITAWHGIVDYAASPHGIGLATALAGSSALVAAVAASAGALMTWFARRREREADAPLISLMTGAAASNGDLPLDVEVINRGPVTIDVQAAEVLQPSGALLLSGRVAGETPAKRVPLNLAVLRAGSSRSESRGGGLGNRVGERAPSFAGQVVTDVGTTWFLLRMPPAARGAIVLRFTVRLRTNRPRVITTTVWQDIPPRP